MTLLVTALLVLSIGGACAAIAAGNGRVSTALGVSSAVLGSLLGLAAIVPVFFSPDISMQLPWGIPGASFALAVDPLSAAFLVPVFGLALVGAPYGAAYWRGMSPRKLAAAWFFFNWLVASMALVAVARDAVLFIVAWEVMTLASYFLIVLDHAEPRAQAAGWGYLVAAHIGVLALFGLFMTLGAEAGSFGFALFALVSPTPSLAAVLFGLGLVGFGVKAALPGLHVWLPDAHAAAPSHVSALLSGAMVNLGVYGLIRLMGWIGEPVAWQGAALVVAGVAGAVLGIALSVVQVEIKRALAYSSIENMGLMVAALGTAVWAASSGLPDVAAVASVAVLLHMWNHAAMKGLLFFATGGIVHAMGTQRLDAMGGLAAKMPASAALMLFGSLAVCGLPPLNGFVSEWLVYISLLQGAMATPGVGGLALFGGASLIALAGGLAVLAFARIHGIALLGTPRSRAAEQAHEAPLGMLWPTGMLAAACLVAALAPGSLLTALQGASQAITNIPGAAAGPYVATLGLLNAGILAVLVAAGLVWGIALRRNRVGDVGTWACGYAAPTRRMQYTSASFGAPFDRLLPRQLRPDHTLLEPRGFFPAGGFLETRVSEPVRDRVYVRLFLWVERAFLRLRWLHQGQLTRYLTHILIFVLGLMLWMAAITE